MKKKFYSIILACCMLFSLCTSAVAVSAQDNTPPVASEFLGDAELYLAQLPDSSSYKDNTVEDIAAKMAASAAYVQMGLPFITRVDAGPYTTVAANDLPFISDMMPFLNVSNYYNDEPGAIGSLEQPNLYSAAYGDAVPYYQENSIPVGTHAIAADAIENAISPIIITETEFDAISAQTTYVGRIMLPHTNPEGSNGNRCKEFVADETNVAFSIVSAPATETYNVQLYHGTVSGGGIPMFLYAKDVPVGSGVWFSNLVVGDTYFFKVSSSKAPVSGSNAQYSYKTFSASTVTISTEVAVDTKN